MNTKSCLKVSPLPSRSGTPDSAPSTPRKCVTWCAHTLEEVFEADDWDRTPHEPCKNLSHSEQLELKSIQRSLPYADQPPDPHTGKPGASRLHKVPLVLLPLLPADSPPSPSTPNSPPQVSNHMLSPKPMHSPYSARCQTSSQPLRKFNIAFTPILPSCSDQIQPPFTQKASDHLKPPNSPDPPQRKKRVFEINGIEFEMDDDEDEPQSDIVRPPLTPPSTPQPGQSSLTSPSPQTVTRKKKVIMVNDMEIELSDDESDDDDNDTISCTTTSTPISSPPQTPPQQLNSIDEEAPKDILGPASAPPTLKPKFQFVPLF